MGFVGDIIESVVDVVVDIVETVVDVVVDVVEAVVSPIADLLGFSGEETIEYFEVHNQPLFDSYTVDHLIHKGIIAESLIKGEDIMNRVIANAIYNDSIPKALNRFHNFIENGDYYTDYPQVESFINYVNEQELNGVLDGIEGTSTTITFSKMGRLTIPYWIETYLRDNNNYNVTTHSIPYNYVYNFTIDATNPAFVNTATNTIIVASTDTLQLGNDIVYTVSSGQTEIGGLTSGTTYYATNVNQTSPGYWELQLAASLSDALNVPPIPVTLTSAGTGTADTFTYSFTADRPVNYTAPTYNASGDNYQVSYTDGTYITTVPSKPTGTHITADYVLDSAPTIRKIFTYKLGTGTYTDLDATETQIDIASDTLKCMPAVPLRLNNTNYNDGSNTDREDKINELLSIVKIDAPSVLDAIFEDYNGSPSDLDHIYVNFGVRLTDTTQGGLNYLFNIFDKLHLSSTTTKADYESATGEKPYNNIVVTHDDYKMVFKWAYTDYTNYTLAEVQASSALSNIYYSSSKNFDSNNNLLKSYFASSVQALYDVQYTASNLTEVNAFLAGNGVTDGSYTSEGAGKLQVTTRIPYSSTIQESDGTTSSHTTLKPSLVYENNSGTLRIAASIEETVTSSQEISYYQIVPNGMNVYTVKAPIGALRVVDADTGTFRMVKFNLANPDDLMLPFFYGIVLEEGVTNKELESLFLASAHCSVYMARYEVIETGGFFKILLIIIIIVVAFFVIGPGSFSFTGTTGATASGAAVTTNAAGQAVYATTAANTAAGVSGTLVPAGTTITMTNSLGLALTHTVAAGSVISFSTIAWVPTIVSFAGQMVVQQIIQAAIVKIAEDVSPELAMALSVAIAFGTTGFSSGKGITLGDTIKATTIVVDSYSGVKQITINQDYEAEMESYNNFTQQLDLAYTDLDPMKTVIDEMAGLQKNMLNIGGQSLRGYINPISAESFYLNTIESAEIIPHTYNFEHIMTKTFDFTDLNRSLV